MSNVCNNVLQHLSDLWFCQLKTIYVKGYWATSTHITVSLSDQSISVAQFSKHKTHMFYMEYKNDIDLIRKISFYNNLLDKLNEDLLEPPF
jgi:hypothetical protein